VELLLVPPETVGVQYVVSKKISWTDENEDETRRS